MSAQTELIEPTDAERARPVLLHLQGEVERRTKAVESAEEKLAEARHLLYLQEQMIARLGAADGGPTTAADPVIAEPPDDEPPAPAVNQETGEVLANMPGCQLAPEPCPTIAAGFAVDCGSCRYQPDGPDEGVVYVYWPDMAEAVESDVGQFTRYVELIADGLAEGEDEEDFEVRGPVEDCEGDELLVCDPTATIPPEDWSKTFRVVAKGGA